MSHTRVICAFCWRSRAPYREGVCRSCWPRYVDAPEYVPPAEDLGQLSRCDPAFLPDGVER